ncbi:hypothetical protein KSP40_PGU021598 [Platanthera guangdongensis]|uniref:Uncharacterized protein n=1 Tax=Platanthera guangdongensis TaxID=2320717 RepID=A0ABR2LVT3_9ASPA
MLGNGLGHARVRRGSYQITSICSQKLVLDSALAAKSIPAPIYCHEREILIEDLPGEQTVPQIHSAPPNPAQPSLLPELVFYNPLVSVVTEHGCERVWSGFDGKSFHLIGGPQSSEPSNLHQNQRRRCTGRGEDGSGNVLAVEDVIVLRKG